MTDARDSTSDQDHPSLLDTLQLRDDTAKPLYQQLEQQLMTLIENGSIAPGTTLPAERQLAAKLGVSRVTVQRSYDGLRQRKLLSAHGRLGSIVQENPHYLHPGMDRLKGFTEEMRELVAHQRPKSCCTRLSRTAQSRPFSACRRRPGS